MSAGGKEVHGSSRSARPAGCACSIVWSTCATIPRLHSDTTISLLKEYATGREPPPDLGHSY
ncbi:hypothetical protein GCM10009767_25420 [Kocuria aegyptia]|uniref:Uncharacterized protein n=1 Tax=Kocuria aegyptia TaxID=330943 RepID=A0ABP4X546_9MICC